MFTRQAAHTVARGKVVFVSDGNGSRGVREQTQPALQLFVMDTEFFRRSARREVKPGAPPC